MISKEKLKTEVDEMLLQEQLELEEWLREAVVKYQPFLEASVKNHLSEMKKRLESKLEGSEAKYDEMTKNGEPFSRRKEVGEKIAWYEKGVRMFDPDDIIVRPLEIWVEYGDVVDIKKHGFHKAIGRPEILNRTYEKRNPTT